uniref:NADH-ubiquinone oxidoreductase chain 2 n=1 Tax=Rhabdopleura compacta TaxID=638968 RepID=F8J476_RHACM|nr:NADH dehydrogenase subunit 2 [Rhabdopleura compacta]
MLGSFEKVLLFFGLLSSLFLFFLVSNWFWIWLLFELNMFSFLPFLCYGRWYRRSICCMRYFLVQAWGSVMILLGVIFYSGIFFTWSCWFNYFSDWGMFIFFVFVFLGTVLKLGLWPVHFWFIKVVEGVSYYAGFLICTIQKVLPLVVLIYLAFFYLLFFYLLFLGIVSGFVGSFGGLVQTRVRRFLAYSSLGGVGWSLVALSYSSLVGGFFFFSYVVSCFSVFFCSYYLGLNSFLGFYRLFSKSGLLGLGFLLGVFSLAGFPPLLGFFSKVSVIFIVGFYGSFFQVFVLCVLGVLSMFFYVWFSFGCFMLVFSSSVSFFGGWFSRFSFLYFVLCFFLGVLFLGGFLFFPLLILFF